jgi:hypothetical protein
MALTKKTYINTELEWAETQLEAWRSYVDANLLHTLVDRVQYKETKGGGDANDCSHYKPKENLFRKQ